MSIKLASETVVTLSKAAEHLPTLRGKHRPHTATLYRWAQRGCRGIRLETIRVGGSLCTSVEAIQRFCESLSRAGSVNEKGVTRAPSQESQAAGDKLAERGI